jgi:hypothetical protein
VQLDDVVVVVVELVDELEVAQVYLVKSNVDPEGQTTQAFLLTS